MTNDRTKTVAELLSDNDLVNLALARASKEALLSHARAGRAVPICPNGQIIWLSPEDVLAKLASAPIEGVTSLEESKN